MLTQSEPSRLVPGPVLDVLRVFVATLWAKLTILPRLELGCRGPRWCSDLPGTTWSVVQVEFEHRSCVHSRDGPPAGPQLWRQQKHKSYKALALDLGGGLQL